MRQTYYESSIPLSNNRKLSYTGYGDSNQNTVIFFHGFGSSAHSIHPDTNILDQHSIRFYAVNRPGYGESDEQVNYSMEEYADWINEFMVAKGIEKTALIGWSAGGLYSQIFTEKYPEKVASLNLVSSAIPLNSGETKTVLPNNWRMIRNMNRYIPFMTKSYFKTLSKKVSKNLDDVIHESVKQMVQEDKKIINDPIIKPAIIKGTVEGYRNSGNGVYYDARALCKKINEPKNQNFSGKVHIWQGGADTIWTSETSNYLRQKYSNSTYNFIDQAGHFLYLSHWDEILKKSVS